jgi:biotin operon repressor
MTKRGFRRVAVFTSVVALAGGAVAGCGSNAATTSGTSSGTGTTQQPAGQNGQPPQGGRIDFTALAKELGVSTTKLQAAMQKVRPQGGQQGQNGGRSDMAANLAKELGLSESKVAAALQKLRPQGGPPAGGNGQAAPSVTPSSTTTS